MNLEELKDQWTSQNEKLEKSLRLNAALLRESASGKTRGALSGLARAIWIELVINFVALLLLGSFIADHVSEPRFLVPAVVLHLFAIGLIVAAVRQLAALAQIDFDAPILLSQKKLESLRIQRIRATKWILILAPLLWTPLFIVALKGFLGVDAYAVFPAAWLLMNLIAGAGLIPLLLWISKRFAGRFGDSPFVQQLMNDIAGRNLAAAQAHLDRLSNFEREASDSES
jgi:hypothetical protein